MKNLDLEKSVEPIFTPDAITALSKHNWPGNVRELKNVIERACIIFPGKEITSSNVYENLLRLKVPTVAEEQDAIWEMTGDLSEINEIEINTNNRILNSLRFRKAYGGMKGDMNMIEYYTQLVYYDKIKLGEEKINNPE